jgi:hypothetical protein
MNVHLSLVSSNSKTGPIPVSTTGAQSCPPDCGQKDGCYADRSFLGMHWRAVTAGARGTDWPTFCATIEQLPDEQLWRHNQAGDCPPDDTGRSVDPVRLGQLVRANIGKRGFTYSHWKDDASIAWFAYANAWGFTVNLSADTIDEADRLHGRGSPVVVVVASTVTDNFTTPAGHRVVICPATQRDDVSCSTCQLCQRQRDAIVAFPAHGSGARRIDIRLAN